MKTSTVFLIPMFLMGGISCWSHHRHHCGAIRTDQRLYVKHLPGDNALTGSAKARQRLERFVVYAYDSVSNDIAKGNGEYLTSLAVLAGIP